jgi:excisionase family DNA binding protein
VRTVFKVSEAAAELGVSKQHILNAIEAGEIGAIDAGIGSRHFWRIPVEELERFKKARNTLAPGGSR